MSERAHGRHRAAGRYNPATELATLVSEATTPMMKGSAVVAATGGLVAALAIPATAAGEDAPAPTAGTKPAATAPALAAPAVAAPEQVTPLVGAQNFGALTVEAVKKPEGPPRWLVEQRQREAQEAREAAERAAQERAAEQERAARGAEREQQEQAAEQSQSSSSEQSGSGSSSNGSSSGSSSSSSSSNGSSSSSSSNGSSGGSSSSTQTQQSAPRATSGGVIGIAKQYTGTPYVYGGSSPSGFDCSGFTQYVFGKAGKSLPRVTTAQQAATVPVSNPQPGDLVFFGSPAWHVGIYVGNGQMIDAPRTGKSVSVRPVFGGVSGYGRVQ